MFLAHISLQSLNHLLAIPGEDNDAINMAIDCVGQANETKLIEDLVRFLMGDRDGMPKVVNAPPKLQQSTSVVQMSLCFVLELMTRDFSDACNIILAPCHNSKSKVTAAISNLGKPLLIIQLCLNDMETCVLGLTCTEICRHVEYIPYSL